jgi:SAM-dependent methyltransferase
MAGGDATQRFSDRVEDYVKYRPGYPPQLVDLMRRAMGLTPASVLADVGSGTGKSAELFLDVGCKVFAIEPNAPMRQAAEKLVGGRANFTSIDARAEATRLPDASVDFVIAGQAFHWFDRAAARREFSRILKPGGHVVLFWNTRKLDASAFSRDYEAMLLAHSPDYATVRHDRDDSRQAMEFFAPLRCAKAIFAFRQDFDFEGLRGRVLSSSYVPKTGPIHKRIMERVRAIFDAHQHDDHVSFEYDTEVFYGRLA